MTICQRLLLVTLVLASLFAAGANSVSGATDDVHVVASGETLCSIALKYDTTVTHLIELNGIADPNTIYTGQRLRISGSPYDLTQNIPVLIQGPWWGRVVVAKVPIRPQPADDEIIADSKRPGLDGWLYYGDTVQVLQAVTGAEIIPGNGYWYLIEAEDPQYVYSAHVIPLELPRDPDIDGTGRQDRWIGVYLKEQLLVAYEGNDAVYSTLVSTGKTGPTPRGLFYINGGWRPATRRMTGGEPGTSDYYDLPNVRWVSYFTARGHALHGTYWHHRFGQPMSHGCINMTNYDAKFLYDWAPAGTPIIVL